MDYLEPYSNLAKAYDYILRHVDYQTWYEYIRAVMHNYVSDPQVVLELGCGTGKFGAKFSQDNYRIIGMDSSLEMLLVAKTRAYKNFRIFCGDMKQFYLAQKCDFIFSVHDTMNYFLEYDDVRSVLSCVRECMGPDSVYLFDITTEHNINRNFHNKKNIYTLHGTTIEWSNRYDRKERCVYSYLTFTDKKGDSRTEQHVQRIYSIDEIKSLLAEQGFEILDILSDYSLLSPGKRSVMVNFVTKLIKD